jgi:hypothetical protein
MGQLMRRTVFTRDESGRKVRLVGGTPMPEWYAARRGSPQVVTSTPPQEQHPAVGGEVPAGNIASVQTWVGDDQDRARRALTAEQAATKPRTSLVAWLTDRAG